MQTTQEGSFLILQSFLGVILLLDSLRGDLKDQWFSLWCQTRSSLLSCPKRSLINRHLAMSSLLSLDPTASLSTSSKLVGIWDGLLVGFRRYYPASRLSSWPKSIFF